ncbi:hypothetical protein [Marinilabilia salmonicolor]|uniref:Uncharacterized protein n=1 Tax=Marinilabilia salmonicolor TaxID=989 RepID=A0A368UN92_9BACT|nr:hypothetical protein [Marinilabilia salmonicolor]RCW30247.1 hypothetical protein DFO77_12373 [Marinilabilia salmonicolor]
MPKNNYVISREKAEVFDAMGIPYEGYVAGVGYQSLHAFALGSCYFQNSNYCIPHFQPVMDASLEEKIKSLRIDGDDLMDKLVKINVGGEPTINMGHGKYLKLSDNCEIVAQVEDGKRFRFGYRDHVNGKEEIIRGKLAEFDDVFGNSELLFDDFKMCNSDNRGSSGILPEKENDGQWLKTANQVNMISGEVFDMGTKVRMNLERIHTSEALVNNRLANGGLAGKYNVLRESAGYMRKFKNVSKYGGRFFFGTGIFLSGVDLGMGLYYGDNSRATFAFLDIVVTTTLFLSGVGIVGIPIYMLYKSIFSPPQIISRPFNPNELHRPYYCEPDNLKVELPFLLK